MLKVRLRNSVWFLLIKYAAFFFVLACASRYQSLVLDKARTSVEIVEQTLAYMLYVFVYSLPLIGLFCLPLYLLLRTVNGVLFLAGLALFFGVEYGVYTRGYSPSDLTLGGYNAVIGVLLLGMFFHQAIQRKFGPPRTTG
ncbi:hypothetical protein [Hymenobacter negativus]|uniref:VanZ-like domain-containing protein n=1 Tax=Hymenobacter negativus TaxID=2795026 RepID=A0ABS3Q9K7_9BACT|nr:hypothetical protein [Hymenobacter negativus]MBO2007907.1 hypothetical protein [Hymenobacter negativus]